MELETVCVESRGAEIARLSLLEGTEGTVASRVIYMELFLTSKSTLPTIP